MQVISGRADQTTETVYRVFCLEEILSSWRLRSYRRTGRNKGGQGQEQQGVEAGADAGKLAHTNPGGSGKRWGWASGEPLRTNP